MYSSYYYYYYHQTIPCLVDFLGSDSEPSPADHDISTAYELCVEKGSTSTLLYVLCLFNKVSQPGRQQTPADQLLPLQ